jgi:hypothetical protein
MLVKKPALMLVVVITLALGIGANTFFQSVKLACFLGGQVT